MNNSTKGLSGMLPVTTITPPPSTITNINYTELEKDALIDLLRSKDLEILRYQSRINQLEALQVEFSSRMTKKDKEKVFKKNRRVSDAGGLPESGQVIDADRVESWTEEFLLKWLEKNNLSELIGQFASQPPLAPLKGPYSGMFEPCDRPRNSVYLAQGSPARLMGLAVLPADAPIRRIWPSETFVRDFLLTFQCFTTLEALLASLGESLAKREDRGTYVGAVNFLKELISFPYHFLNSTQQFEDTLKQALVGFELLELNGLMVQVKPRDRTPLKLITVTNTINAVTEKELVEQKKSDSYWDNLDLTVVAKQISAWHLQLMARMSSSDFLNKQWTNEKGGGAEALKDFIRHTTNLGNWVATEIINPMFKEKRAERIVFFIRLALLLRDSNDYHGLMVVVGALQSSQVSKMKKTWLLVPKKEVEDLEKMVELMNPNNNYRNYTDHLSNVVASMQPQARAPVSPLVSPRAAVPVTLQRGGVVIPFFNAVLRDLFMIDEQSPNFVTHEDDEDLSSSVEAEAVDWFKMAKVGKQIWKILQFAKINDASPPQVHAELRDWILMRKVWSHGEIMYAIATLRDHYPKVTTIMALQCRVEPKLTERHIDFLIENNIPVKKEHVVIQKGAKVDTPYYFHKGSVTRYGKDGQHGLAPHSFIGIEALLYDMEFISDDIYISYENTLLYELKDDFIQKVIEDDEMFVVLNKSLAYHVAHKFSKRESIACDDDEKEPLSEEATCAKVTYLPSELSKNKEEVLHCIKCSKKTKLGSVRGELYVTREKFCFLGSNFGFKEKDIIKIARHLGTLTQVKEKNEIRLTYLPALDSKKEVILSLTGFEDVSATFEILEDRRKIKSRALQASPRGSPRVMVSPGKLANSGSDISPERRGRSASVSMGGTSTDAQDSLGEECADDDWRPTNQEWERILAGSVDRTYKAGEVIVQQGELKSLCIYQIQSGTCEVIKEEGKVLKEMTAGDIFGELAFILRNIQHVSASVVATKNVSLKIIYTDFLEQLFSYFPRLEGSFYYYLATVIGARIATKTSTTPTSDRPSHHRRTSSVSVPKKQMLSPSTLTVNTNLSQSTDRSGEQNETEGDDGGSPVASGQCSPHGLDCSSGSMPMVNREAIALTPDKSEKGTRRTSVNSELKSSIPTIVIQPHKK